MTLREHADVLDSTVEDVVLSMWTDADVQAADPSLAAGRTGDEFWATVPLDGTLPLLVGVTCDRELADRVAVHLFGEHTVTDADRLDALGELANLVAGRVKVELCPGGSTGLPTTGMGGGTGAPDGPGSDYLVDGALLRLDLRVRVA
jgi:CheY-specific phosphatase CheX